MRKYFLLVCFLLVIIGCSKNDSNNSVKKIKSFEKEIILDKTFTPLLTISAGEYYTRPRDVALDDSLNIFILDRDNSKIVEYNLKSREFIKSFSNKGKGPGEMLRPGNILLQDDTLYVTDFRQRCLHLFSTEGTFIEKKNLKGNNIPIYLSKIKGIGFVAGIMTRNHSDTENYIINTIQLFDNNLTPLKEIYFHKEKISNDSRRHRVPDQQIVLNGNDYIYQNVISKYQYKIIAYNHKGEKQAVLTRRYSPIAYSNLENEEFLSRWKRRKLTSEMKKRILDNRGKQKNSVENLYYDVKQGELWVERASRSAKLNERHFDVYKDLQYKGSFVINADYNDQIILNNNYLIIISDEDASIKIMELY